MKEETSTEEYILYIIFFLGIMGMSIFYSTQLENEQRWPWDTETIWLHHNLKTGCGVIAILAVLKLAWKYK